MRGLGPGKLSPFISPYANASNILHYNGENKAYFGGKTDMLYSGEALCSPAVLRKIVVSITKSRVSSEVGIPLLGAMKERCMVTDCNQGWLRANDSTSS